MAGGFVAAHSAAGTHTMRSARISAAVSTTSKASTIGATAVEAAASAEMAATTTSTVAAPMLGESELRNENECCRSNGREKYLQNSGFPHIDNPLPNYAGLA